ncbi:hypothetical protein Cgig2_009898 [Carnegiea gigantea]|uniref:Uncharacterized protein n=1 Tax=Carnegiea gigantea TaxID=171969 RepID=A0A9Q1QFN1_9CARY|nr:hypothetical protein Cgig2_009898 [Carnegiea gigantea]
MGVLHGRMLREMESALTELRWSTFESWVWLYGNRIFEARFWAKAEPKEDSSRARQQEEDSEAEQRDESSATEGWPPLLMMISRSQNFRLKEPRSEFADATHISKMVQINFYAMVINDAAELRLVNRETRGSLMLDLQELRWDIIEAWLLSIGERLKDTQVRERRERKRKMVRFPNFTSTETATKYIREAFLWPWRETSAQRPRPLPGDHFILCPSFDLGMATRHAQGSNIPKMVQAIFYAMVVNEVVEWGITCKITAGCLMWVLQQLHWDPFEFWFENVEYRLRGARASRPVNPPTNLASSSGPVETSGLSDAPLVSNDEE